ncbi:class I SAM-dependent methyltransferase [Maribacter aurantiacus]|uniref:Class I SAM-dependent methyltransferase n=1 Tax=Maribacter aurantiacus TaxID=1882343 RepID=A0A5R8M3C3_9FLAO|nr:class I SAM-dependent methyltransferase [Maribacter aurantiacus]TLF44118.1 class I SAM-dependent methyltransferase [Maribacter aurantiacus]
MPTKKPKKPWPTKAVMEQIYEQYLWGGNPGEFYSGDGSHDPAMVEPYLKAVTHFLRSFHPPLTVCDLGCGDFTIGKRLVPYTREYIAVDIVEDLITWHKKNNALEQVSFHCLDIAKDSLPQADCIILRQVLQHLSNEEIKAIVKKLSNYTYVLVTEHLTEDDFEPNIDIISGQGIRLKKQSGVDLLAPPFLLKVKEAKELVAVPSTSGKGVVSTNLYTIM